MEAAHDLIRNGRHDGDGAARELVVALESRHPPVRGHSRTVATLARRLARELALADAEEGDVHLGATLHDVGKLALPPALLRKRGPLSDAEWRLVRAHPADGERLLRPVLAHRPHVLAAVRSHHERWDGAGYPDGLVGGTTPRAALIVAVADAFTAMTEDRPYRPALSRERALGEVRDNAESQFDPDCVAALRAVVRAGL